MELERRWRTKPRTSFNRNRDKGAAPRKSNGQVAGCERTRETQRECVSFFVFPSSKSRGSGRTSPCLSRMGRGRREVGAHTGARTMGQATGKLVRVTRPAMGSLFEIYLGGEEDDAL